jgi:predicted phage baseplate assembly protein
VQPADGGAAADDVWVHWRRVPNFRLSGPRSRHYLLDSVAAIVQFGNGVRGLIPPVGRNNLVVRDMRTGGGASANREAPPLAVKELKTSLPFIDKVFNVQAASAGASPWTTEQFEEFGPQSLKNRGRAVTAEDYEWMIRQRFSDVARVRCLPVTEPGPGGVLQFKAGGITALVVPWSTAPRPQPSQGLMRKVQEYLAYVVLENIVADVHAKGPDYVAIDIAATLVPIRAEFALVVARKAQAAIDAFLHPLTGGEDGNGYGFGRPIFLSEVHAVLERIEEVDHVVSASFVAAPGANAYLIDGNVLPSSGVHAITVLAAGS